MIVSKSKLKINADGCPNAYHPNDKSGIDKLSYAGHSGNWWGVVTDTLKKTGTPIVQGPNDPYPGYYISMTALSDRKRCSRGFKSPRAYVDSSKENFMVIPRKSEAVGWALGDFGTVCNTQNGKCVHVLVADVGPVEKFGETSIHAA